MDAIREAAAQVLVEEGAAAASTTRIAKVAGVSVGTLYQYYSDRSAVLDDVTAQLLDKVLEAVSAAAALPAETSLQTRLEMLATAAFGVFVRYPGVLRRLDALPDQRVRDRLDAAKAQGRALFLGVLSAHPETLAGRDPTLVTRIAADIAEGILWNIGVDDEPEVIGREVAALTTAWLTAPR